MKEYFLVENKLQKEHECKPQNYDLIYPLLARVNGCEKIVKIESSQVLKVTI